MGQQRQPRSSGRKVQGPPDEAARHDQRPDGRNRSWEADVDADFDEAGGAQSLQLPGDGSFDYQFGSLCGVLEDSGDRTGPVLLGEMVTVVPTASAPEPLCRIPTAVQLPERRSEGYW